MNNLFCIGPPRKILQDNVWKHVRQDPITKKLINTTTNSEAQGVAKVTLKCPDLPVDCEVPFIHHKVLKRSSTIPVKKSRRRKSRFNQSSLRKDRLISMESICTRYIKMTRLILQLR